MSLQALGARVLVRIEVEKETTSGGLIIPEAAQSTSPFVNGTVESAGAEIEEIEVGDVIKFNRVAGLAIEPTLLLVDKAAIICRVSQ